MEKPGSKGLSLNSTQWKILSDNLEAVNNAVKERDEKYFLELTSSKAVSVSSYNGELQINLREFFDNNGQRQPGN